MALYRVFLEATHITKRQFGVINNLVFELKRESNNVFYRKNMVSDLIFQEPNDYAQIFALSPYENEEVEVSVEIDCDGWIDYWKGSFTIVDCQVNQDHCVISVRPKVKDRYSCILSKMDEDVSLWDSGTNKVNVKLTGDSFLYYKAEWLTVTSTVQGVLPLDITITTGDPEWWLELPQRYDGIETDLGGGVWEYTKARYHHLVGFGTDTIPPDPSGKWFRWRNTTDAGDPPLPFVGAWRWVSRPNRTSKGFAPLDNGQGFANSIRAVLLRLNCGINDLSTTFFGYNPLIAPTFNSAYLWSNTYGKYITVHQKSDVKRPYDDNSNEDKTWFCKLNDLFEDLKVMFKAYWDIDDDGNFILEHISYFKDLGTVQSLTVPQQKYQYDYDDLEAISKETFKYADEQCGEYFRGWPIRYLVRDGEVKENKLRLISTDVYYIQDSQNAENIQDKGFVLCSNVGTGSVRNIKQGNIGMSWTLLHEYLHRHDRPYQEFYMNDMLNSALYLRKKKQQEPFMIPGCCDTEFDPFKLYNTALGDGEVDSATYDIAKDLIKIKLTY